ncbi:MAG: hypothetical protein ACRELF_19265, partial [Gemmataceae bacterium]
MLFVLVGNLAEEKLKRSTAESRRHSSALIAALAAFAAIGAERIAAERPAGDFDVLHDGDID